MKLREELTNVRYCQSAARRSLEFCLSPMATRLLKSVLLKDVSIAIHLRTRDPGGTQWRPSLTIPAEASDEVIKGVTEELQRLPMQKFLDDLYRRILPALQLATILFEGARPFFMKVMFADIEPTPQGPVFRQYYSPTVAQMASDD